MSDNGTNYLVLDSIREGFTANKRTKRGEGAARCNLYEYNDNASRQLVKTNTWKGSNTRASKFNSFVPDTDELPLDSLEHNIPYMLIPRGVHLPLREYIPILPFEEKWYDLNDPSNSDLTTVCPWGELQDKRSASNPHGLPKSKTYYGNPRLAKWLIWLWAKSSGQSLSAIGQIFKYNFFGYFVLQEAESDETDQLDVEFLPKKSKLVCRELKYRSVWCQCCLKNQFIDTIEDEHGYVPIREGYPEFNERVHKPGSLLA